MSEPSITGYYTLKSGEGFALLDPQGMIPDDSTSPCGIVWRNMRHVARHEPRLGGAPLKFLHADSSRENELRFYYTNSGFTDRTGKPVSEGALRIERRLTAADGRLHEKLTMENKSKHRVDTVLCYHAQAGFEDIFDIRNTAFLSSPAAQRQPRGKADAPVATGRLYSQHYNWKNGNGGNDSEWRFSQPVEAETDILSFYMSADPGEKLHLYSSCGPRRPGGMDASAETYKSALACAKREHRKLSRLGPVVSSSNASFDRALNRSFKDLSMLTADLETGPYPLAGLPWFCTPFGRDADITALLMLPFYPAIAHGVLKFQAEKQAKSQDLFRQAEPGKVFHEVRTGSESAALGENPFESYYGGVDTTLLFVLLAGKYYERTGDRAFTESIWPEIKSALQWMTDNMDANGGYVRYFYDKDGLTQQGWKDSKDSVFHVDAPDVLPPDPIALCEVQAYAYGALRRGALLADMFGAKDSAARWTAMADDLYIRFNKDFWMPAMNTYALAVDGGGKQCAVSTSNAGHCFFTGIVPDERSPLLAATLMGPAIFSGFGIRTLAEGPGYNPVSYHRGSVWPHDTAMIAIGMAEYGLSAEVSEIMKGLMAATDDDPRLPELFSGAARVHGQAKAPYPSACAPQSWAAASLYGVLGACLRPHFDLAAKTVDVSHAALPPEAGTIRITKWPVGGKRLNIQIAP